MYTRMTNVLKSENKEVQLLLSAQSSSFKAAFKLPTIELECKTKPSIVQARNSINGKQA